MYELLVFICSGAGVFGALVMLGSVDASDAGLAFGSILSVAT